MEKIVKRLSELEFTIRHYVFRRCEMKFIEVDLHTNRFTCCYRDEGSTAKQIETFNLNREGLAAFYRTLTEGTEGRTRRRS
jgi:hypothetical protein